MRAALAAGLLALALPAATGGTIAVEPPVAYPDELRAVGGGDPLKGVPPPDECSRARDTHGRNPYFSLRRAVAATNPFLKKAAGSVRIDLVNRKQQRFSVYVSASTPAMVKRFVATSRACFEYFETDKGPGKTVEPVQFAGLLVKYAVADTGKSQSTLATARDSLVAAGSPAALNDVVTQAGGHPDVVVDKAAAAASAALAAKVAAGQLTAAEVAALDVHTIVAALAAQPKATFLYPASDIPPTLAKLAAQLAQDERGVVVVGAIPVEPRAKQMVIWFAFDPTFGIGTGATHNYVAQCRRSAWAEVYSYSGAERLNFWRQSPYYLSFPSKTASAATKDVKTGHSSYPNWRGYDTSVYGVNAGQYSIYGGYTWYQGSGGGC